VIEGDANVTQQLGAFDGAGVQPQIGRNLFFNFGNRAGVDLADLSGKSGGVLLGGWTVHGGRGTFGKCCIEGTIGPTQENQLNLNNTVSLPFRERRTLIYVPLENLSLSFKMRIDKEIVLDYVNLGVKEPSSIVSSELKLLTATHSRLGNVTTSVMSTDGMGASLSPGENIALEFDATPLASDMKRDFILVSHGRYVRIDHSAKEIPSQFALAQNFPNPFNPTTMLSYSLPADVHVTLNVYDVLGREVARLVDEFQSAGYKSVEFDAGKLPSGVYYYRLTAGTFNDIKKMLLTK